MSSAGNDSLSKLFAWQANIGDDVKITVRLTNGRILGEASSISWSVTRDPTPIYTVGMPSPPWPFFQEQRAIAGNLVMVKFDKEEALSTTKDFKHNSDLTPPFNIVIEKDGDKVTLYGAELLDKEAKPLRIDDVYFDEPTLFVARHLGKGEVDD